MIKEIKVVGLQRSGTNYLEQLLKENFDVKVLTDPMDPFFKHAMPGETETVLNDTRKKVLFSDPAKFLRSKKRAVLLIVKPFDHWFASICTKPADLVIKRPGILNKSNRISKQRAFNLYTSYHSLWAKYTDKIIVVDYPYLLKERTENLYIIKEKLKLTAKHDTYVDVDKVPQSKKFTPEDRKKYLA